MGKGYLQRTCGEALLSPQRAGMAEQSPATLGDNAASVKAGSPLAIRPFVRKKALGPQPDGIGPAELMALDAAVREGFGDGDALPRDRARGGLGDGIAMVDALLALLAEADRFGFGRRERLPALGAG